MSDDVVSVREVDDDAAVAIAINHLRSVPQGVVELRSVMDRRHHCHPVIVDRVAVEDVLIELGDARRFVECAFRRWIGGAPRVRHRRARRGLRMLAIIDGHRRCWGEFDKCAGMRVSGTMLATTLLLYRVAVDRWNWKPALAVPIVAFFGAIDSSFLAANSLKIMDGGWFPVAVGGGVALLMLCWREGASAVMRRLDSMSMPVREF